MDQEQYIKQLQDRLSIVELLLIRVLDHFRFHKQTSSKGYIEAEEYFRKYYGSREPNTSTSEE